VRGSTIGNFYFIFVIVWMLLLQTASSFLAKGLTHQKLLQSRRINKTSPFRSHLLYGRGYSESVICSQKDDNILSVHISPDGDWWLGTEIYAAKHNPSNYVRSIKLPANFDEDNNLLGSLPESSFTLMYDTGLLDSSLFPTVPVSTNNTASHDLDSEPHKHDR
jgi:hypothetical protein